MNTSYPYIITLIVISLVVCGPFQSHGQSGYPASGNLLISNNGRSHIHVDLLKSTAEKPFHIEAVYETTECSQALSSIEVNNAHFPLTWYELNEFGQRVHILFNPEIYWFNNHTTYVVEDFTKHTDTIYIEFYKSLELKKIFPNPHQGQLYLQYSAMETTNMNIRIVDTMGRLVLAYDQVLTEGEHQAALNLDELHSGVYFLSLNALCINELVKIIHLK